MARLYTNGFEVPGHLGLFTMGSVTAVGSSTTFARSGVYSLGCGSSLTAGRNVGMLIPGTPTELYIRMAVLITEGGNREVISVRSDVTDDLVQVFMNTGSNWQVKVNGSVVITGAVPQPPAVETWYLVELYVKLADAGAAELKVDGNSQGTYAGDTKPGADTYWKELWIGTMGGNMGSIYYDDLAINDVSGGSDNSWCGDGHVIAIHPDGAGSSTQWTPNAGANYAAVDEVTPDDDTTYVMADAVDEIDLYALSNPSLPNGSTIKRVWVEAVARKNTGEQDNLQVGLKAGTTTSWSSTHLLTNNYLLYLSSVYALNPDDSAAWEVADLNSLEAGVKAVS